MLKIYESVMGASSYFMRSALQKRCKNGKEDPERIHERMGIPGQKRPDSPVIWFHAASVGEAQSALILIKAVMKRAPQAHILVTTGTVTSAGLMADRLPDGTTHQYYPLDHPRWVKKFLDYWTPDIVLWMESEIWPNMLNEIRIRQIPAALVNARISEQSFRRWKLASGEIKKLLSAFDACLAQTEEDAAFFEALGCRNIHVTDNLKYSASALPCDEDKLAHLKKAVGNRPVWLYASTHEGEEELASRLHRHIKKSLPDLLTIIVPRHPARREQITNACEKYGLKVTCRGASQKMPDFKDDIYIADTLGEMGIFYCLSPIACIGRSFSNDGGGGHNPIEAARLDCAILHGPKVQNLGKIYEDFDRAGAALALKDEKDFQSRLGKLLNDPEGLAAMQNKATRFTREKGMVLDKVLDKLEPVLATITDEEDAQIKAA